MIWKDLAAQIMLNTDMATPAMPTAKTIRRFMVLISVIPPEVLLQQLPDEAALLMHVQYQ